MENFSCSTPPLPTAPSPAKLSMEMGTGMRFGKKKLSNRDSPCRRQPWPGWRALGVKTRSLQTQESPVCHTHQEPGTPIREAHYPRGGGAEGVSQTLPGSAGISPGTTIIQDSFVRLSRKGLNCILSTPETHRRSRCLITPQNGPRQRLRAARRSTAKLTWF